MRYFSLPGTTLRPSVIGLGTALFGSSLGAENSFRLLDDFAAVGGNFLDTAHCYAAWLPGGAGQSETTLGRWLKKSGHRSQMIVATKGGHHRFETPHVSRLAPECIAQDVQESLERLQVDAIDLYYLHRDDPSVPAGEILDALQPHLRAGRLKAIGASNWSPARLQGAFAEASARGYVGFCCSQCGWSLAETNPALQGQYGMYYIGPEALQFYRGTGFPLIGFSSQAQGFFAQSWAWPRLANPTAKQAALQPAYYSQKNVGRWERARALAAQRGCSANDIALAYLTSQPFPSAALISSSRPEQLRSSLAGADLELSPAEISYLEKDLSP